MAPDLDLAAENARLRSELAEARASLERAQRLIARYRKPLVDGGLTAQEKVATAKRRMDDAEAELAEARASLERTKVERNEARNEVVRAWRERDEAVEARENANALSIRLEGERDRAVERAEAAEAEMNAMHARTSESVAERNDALNRLAVAERELERLRNAERPA